VHVEAAVELVLDEALGPKQQSGQAWIVVMPNTIHKSGKASCEVVVALTRKCLSTRRVFDIVYNRLRGKVYDPVKRCGGLPGKGLEKCSWCSVYGARNDAMKCQLEVT
jgi:hypothetical protein